MLIGSVRPGEAGRVDGGRDRATREEDKTFLSVLNAPAMIIHACGWLHRLLGRTPIIDPLPTCSTQPRNVSPRFSGFGGRQGRP